MYALSHNQVSQRESALVELTLGELTAVNGGMLDKEQLTPKKFGATEYAVYVDGVYMGTAYANPGDYVQGRDGDPSSIIILG
jgi:hypothetical protein